MKDIVRPENKWDLIQIIKKEVEAEGWSVDLNHIDVGHLTDFSLVFSYLHKLEKFTGNISQWDVSNAENMSMMFRQSGFDGDLSNWDIRRVKFMSMMFSHSSFNQDLSRWDVAGVEKMDLMFSGGLFDHPLESWEVSESCNATEMFSESGLLNRLVQKEGITEEGLVSDFESVRILWRKHHLYHSLAVNNLEKQIKKVRL